MKTLNYFQPIKLKQLQKRTLGEGVNVLIMGTGCETRLEELKDVIELPSVFADDLPGDNERWGHETQVCSIIKFIAPKSKLYSLDMDNTNVRDVLLAFKWVVENYDKYKFDLINLSTNTGNTKELKDLLIKLKDKGGILLSTTGNDGADTPNYPAAWSKEDLCISIGSCNFKWQKSSFSNAGEDVLLPGEGLQTLWKGYDRKIHPKEYKYMYSTGTSFACPIATGILALAMSRFEQDGIGFYLEGAKKYIQEYVKTLV